MEDHHDAETILPGGAQQLPPLVNAALTAVRDLEGRLATWGKDGTKDDLRTWVRYVAGKATEALEAIGWAYADGAITVRFDALRAAVEGLEWKAAPKTHAEIASRLDEFKNDVAEIAGRLSRWQGMAAKRGDLADPMSARAVAKLLAEVGIGEEVEPHPDDKTPVIFEPLSKRTLRHRVETAAPGTVYAELRDAQLPDGKFDAFKVWLIYERLRARVEARRAEYEREKALIDAEKAEADRASGGGYDRMAQEAFDLTGGDPIGGATKRDEPGRTGTS